MSAALKVGDSSGAAAASASGPSYSHASAELSNPMGFTRGDGADSADARLVDETAGLSTKPEWVAKKTRVDREVEHAADWRRRGEEEAAKRTRKEERAAKERAKEKKREQLRAQQGQRLSFEVDE